MQTEVYNAGTFDIAVVGAGHAGIEAALAAARLGASVVVFTINADAVGNLPCNPSIGGTAKGTLVREIDALGGAMARAADACGIQFRMLNRSKGPAVRSPRAQTDRFAYRAYMKRLLESTYNVYLKQAEIVDIAVDDSGAVCGVLTANGALFHVKRVVIASGTYLDSRVITGQNIRAGGPDGLFGASGLTSALLRLGIPIRRFKTGTPPRILRRSADFGKMEEQRGEDDIPPFSFETAVLPESRAVCHLTYTNEKTHEIIRQNLHRSPLYDGTIEGTGPRYCPSIEDKVVRFADKSRHPVFVEPTGENDGELYLQGLSSSLPEDVQIALVRTVEGLENAEFIRTGYAIEYDCADPLAFYPTLESKTVKGLYAAGQFLGTSGYEEAAALGLVAGANAVLSIPQRSGIAVNRANSYIGVMIDDLVTKGTNEPYRMMTSRAEHRLLLRQDNADARLCGIAHEVGLISRERFERVEAKYEAVRNEIERLQKTKATGEFKAYSVASLLSRPEMSYTATAPFDPSRPALPPDICEQAELEVKYAGYIARAQSDLETARRGERARLDGIDYDAVQGLRTEAREKLKAVRPASIGQASRIAGITPSDIAALLVAVKTG